LDTVQQSNEQLWADHEVKEIVSWEAIVFACDAFSSGSSLDEQKFTVARSAYPGAD